MLLEASRLSAVGGEGSFDGPAHRRARPTDTRELVFSLTRLPLLTCSTPQVAVAAFCAMGARSTPHSVRPRQLDGISLSSDLPESTGSARYLRGRLG